MSKLENFARGAIVAGLGFGAGIISLIHVYRFAMQHSAPGTLWWTGVIIAAVSELMPLGVMLHIRGQKAAGYAASWGCWGLLLLAGAFSLWAQVVTAVHDVPGWAVAAFPTLCFIGLMKVMLGKGKKLVDEGARPEQPSVELPEPSYAATTQAAPLPAFEAMSGNEGRPEIKPGPAAATGEAATGPDEDATPSSPAANRGGSPGRGAASRAEKVAAVQAARRELGEAATQAEVAEKVGCSAATVSRIEGQLRRSGSCEREAQPVVLKVVKAG